MGFLLPAILGGSALLGGALNNRGKKTTTQQSGTTTTTPTFAPGFGSLRDAVIGRAMNRLRNPTGAFGAPFQNAQISKINDTYDAVRRSAANRAIEGGTAGSANATGALQNLDTARAGSIVDFQNQIPGMEREAGNQDFAAAMQALGFGTGTSSATTGTATQTTPGNALGGGISSLAGMLGFLYGQGAFGGGGKGGGVNPVGGGYGG